MDKTAEILELIRPHVDSAETFAVSAESVKVEYKAGKLRSSEVQETSGVSIRAINEGKLGFYATTDLTEKQKLLDSVLTSAKFGGEVTFEFAKPAQGEVVEAYSSETARMDIQELSELARKLATKIEEKTDPNEVTVEVKLERSTYDLQLANTNSVNHKDKRTVLAAQVFAQRVRGDDVLFSFNVHAAVAPDAVLDRLTDNVLLTLERANRLVKMDTKEGALPVVFTPAGSILLFYPFMMGLSGKNAHLGVSPLASKVGEQLLDSRFSLIDEPIVPNSPSSNSIDDEGVLTKPVAFIDKGVVTGFYHNLKSAGEAGVSSTGHGQRSMLGQPGASFHNPLIAGGQASFKELIGDIKEGLLVDSVLGMGQTNIMAGQFSNSVNVAFKIENGEIVGRVKDVSIAGNVYDLLKNNLADMTQESELVYAAARLPYVRLDGVSTVSNN